MDIVPPAKVGVCFRWVCDFRPDLGERSVAETGPVLDDGDLRLAGCRVGVCQAYATLAKLLFLGFTSITNRLHTGICCSKVEAYDYFMSAKTLAGYGAADGVDMACRRGSGGDKCAILGRMCVLRVLNRHLGLLVLVTV